MIHLLNFIAGMNSTLEYDREEVKLTKQPAQLDELDIFPQNFSESMESCCCDVADYSVKALRKRFLSGNQEAPEVKPRSATATIERLLVCTCHEHTKEISEVESSERQLDVSPSVLELKKRYEAKVQALSKSSSLGSSVGSPVSRPVSSRMEARQDMCALDLPHPEGQMPMYNDGLMRAKLSTRWSVVNTSVVEVPNGMQITFTVMKDSNH
uniref:Uncharacterized protein n=1 Tax=Anopheles farauti TaxID=69004 RepID=A0A182QTJ4_9DIPT